MDYSSLVEFDIKNERKKKVQKKDTVAKKNTSKHEETRKRSRSTSPQPREVVPLDESINYNIPNRQYGDLFCVLCDSHMNSEQIWENHIIGKRHMKNTRKGDTVEQKYEYSNEEPTIQKELDKQSPVAGLEHICEILRINQSPIYQCFLCSASLTTSKLLIEHIMGLKHQLSFLKEHDKEKYSLVDSAELSKAYLEPIVKDLMTKYEQEHGRGKMSVKKEKGKPGSSSKKSSNGAGNNRDSNSRHSSKSSKRSPSSKSSRHSSPPRSTSRYSPQSPSCSPPPLKSARKKECPPDSEWQKVQVHERSRERRYSDRSYYSDEDSTCYRRSTPTYPETYSRLERNDSRLERSDSRLERTNNYGHSRSSLDKGQNGTDLRAVLEQKKNLGMTATKANLDAIAPSCEINSITEKLLSLVNDMTPEVFLKLAIFKMNKMVIEKKEDIVFLDRIAELCLDIKRKYLAPDLKAKFQEALAQNGLSSQDNSSLGTSSQSQQKFTQNLDDFIGHFKARKSTLYDDVHSQRTYSSSLTSSDSKPMSHHQLNASSSFRNTPERTPTYDSDWNQRHSSSLPFQSFSSTPSYIPGLTLTEETPPQPSTVMSQFAQTAKPIFGNINVPLGSGNPYQNEDYNRLNYRY